MTRPLPASLEQPERPLRRDAERNRRRILQAAREVFAARGLTASLDDIAAHAEVGVGTVYRRFPDKQELIDALFEESLHDVAAVLEGCLEEPDPWTGFAAGFERIVELQAADRGLMQLLVSADSGGERVARTRDRLAPLGERLLRRAQADGSVRDDLEPGDVPLVHVMLASLIVSTQPVEPALWRRYVALTLDGLRAERTGPTPLPVPAPSVATTDEALRTWCPGR